MATYLQTLNRRCPLEIGGLQLISARAFLEKKALVVQGVHDDTHRRRQYAAPLLRHSPQLTRSEDSVARSLRFLGECTHQRSGLSWLAHARTVLRAPEVDGSHSVALSVRNAVLHELKVGTFEPYPSIKRKTFEAHVV